MKIQRRIVQQPTSSMKHIYQYCISILLGAVLAMSFFVIKDFFFYRLHNPDGSVRNESLREIICDYNFSRELERFVPKENVPKSTIVIYEAMFLFWLSQRADKAIQSIIVGGSVGAIIAMVIKQIITSKRPIQQS